MTAAVEEARPQVVVLDGFVVEAYARMEHVPFATVREQRGSAPKTSEHERRDGLYGRCRICVATKRGEQLLLCDGCDRAFHMTCLHPPLKDVPKGDWHCPDCVSRAAFFRHSRATAVANLRAVLHDISSRPTLPLKLRLKLLHLSAPESPPPVPPHAPPPPLPRPRAALPLHALPPKARAKRLRSSHPTIPPPQPPQPPPPPPTHLQTLRARNLITLTDQLLPVAQRMQNHSATDALSRLRARLTTSPSHHTTLHQQLPQHFPQQHLHPSASKRTRNGTVIVPNPLPPPFQPAAPPPPNHSVAASSPISHGSSDITPNHHRAL
ncbi:hypothetical protein BWQ96_02929 [Gracilariopsis chorda]|uniref:PHD-type domain-containing protein n=1 Tax=Gracilariopsis chorda TaxID=448386 RepID=A0A2V3IYS9_9FLOR|nr:hypothetical protein BWQ96_02929 [Gracilariopsis chorda]|eukprot:PXF47316.1 hypothetical protein BWQ96_02929 [Gracilariopsis chorda]